MSVPEPSEISDLIPASLMDGAAPVFAEPWQAQAFALTVTLHQAGCFTWSEWASALGTEIARAGDADLGGARYYEFWLGALEKLVVAKGIASPTDIDVTAAAWRDAYLRTPHGQPVDLHAAGTPAA